MKKLYDINNGCQNCFLIKCECIPPQWDCPCSDKGCCENPNVIIPKHKCQYTDFCEDCMSNECTNCGAVCACDL